MNPDKFEERAGALINTVEAALADLRSGGAPDYAQIKTIEIEADILCAEIKKATPETARLVQPALAEAISLLDTLAQYLNEKRQGTER